MNIADLLTPDRVLILDRQMDKTGLLRTLAACAAAALKLDPDHLAEELHKREELGSTGMGSGVAIPHARIAEVTHPLGVLALLRKPVDFDAIDDEPVDVVFLLIMPTNQAALAALARVARVLRQQDVTNSLRKAAFAADAFVAVSGLSAPTVPSEIISP